MRLSSSSAVLAGLCCLSKHFRQGYLARGSQSSPGRSQRDNLKGPLGHYTSRDNSTSVTADAATPFSSYPSLFPEVIISSWPLKHHAYDHAAIQYPSIWISQFSSPQMILEPWRIRTWANLQCCLEYVPIDSLLLQSSLSPPRNLSKWGFTTKVVTRTKSLVVWLGIGNTEY